MGQKGIRELSVVANATPVTQFVRIKFSLLVTSVRGVTVTQLAGTKLLKQNFLENWMLPAAPLCCSSLL